MMESRTGGADMYITLVPILLIGVIVAGYHKRKQKQNRKRQWLNFIHSMECKAKNLPEA
jgi:hypothetical protein